MLWLSPRGALLAVAMGTSLLSACGGGGNDCNPPKTLCGTKCVNVNKNENHCGVCGVRCAPSTICEMGYCVCQLGRDCPDPNGFDEMQYQAAKQLFNMNKHGMAAMAFELFIQQHPFSIRVDNAHFFLGRSYFYQGKFMLALINFTQVHAAVGSPLRDESLIWAGRSEYRMGERDRTSVDPQGTTMAFIHYTNAEGFFMQLFAEHPNVKGPDLQTALYFYAMCAFRRADFPTALLRFNDLHLRAPRGMWDDNADFFMGRAMFESGDIPGAIQQWNYYLMVHTTDPRATHLDEANYWLGRAHHDLLQCPLALPFLTTVTMQYPMSPMKARAHKYKVLCFMALNDCLSAKTEFGVVQAQHPRSSLLLETQGLLAGACP